MKDGEIELHDAVPGARPGAGGANVCHMPEPEAPRMAAIYRGIRETIVRAHCADKRDHHKCAGAITITRDTITLNCPRCGDVRKTIGEGRMKKGPIYEPRGQAGEYAPWAANLYEGCGHKCSYCYVPLVTKQPRPEFDAGAVLRPRWFERLSDQCDAWRKDYPEQALANAQVMLSFLTDPYHPGDNGPTRDTLTMLRHYGLSFCTLTKGGTRALRDIDLFRPERDAFASTLTSLDAAFSQKWERAAALPHDRIAALLAFRRAGIFTWVSLEPTLDIEHSLRVVDATYEFVDFYKVGRANYLKKITRTTDWEGYTLRMIEKLTALDKKFYIKQDLQIHLPAGIENPLRVPQHH